MAIFVHIFGYRIMKLLSCNLRAHFVYTFWLKDNEATFVFLQSSITGLGEKKRSIYNSATQAIFPEIVAK